MITSIKMLFLFVILTGGLYPLLITGIGQLLFHDCVNGSLVVVNKKIRGSALIGQKFSSERYFWGRPSSVEYNAECSGATNFSPLHPEFKKSVLARQESFCQAHKIVDKKSVPAEIILCSGSGLDPHITYQAAYLQVGRIASVRNLSEEKKKQLLHILHLNRKYINLLELNLALDNLCE